jgi:hypothetical protein
VPLQTSRHIPLLLPSAPPLPPLSSSQHCSTTNLVADAAADVADDVAKDVVLPLGLCGPLVVAAKCCLLLLLVLLLRLPLLLSRAPLLLK